MRRFAFVLLMVSGLMVSGCGGEWLKHDTAYKSWDHMKFSWFGYQNPTDEDMQKSMEQGWWGFEVPEVPGE